MLQFSEIDSASHCAENTYRPVLEPSIALPMGLRSVGHCRARAGWPDTAVPKTFVQLFWGVQGKGVFVIDDKEHVLDVGDTVVFYPGDVHLLSALTDEWEYRFLTVDGPCATEITREFGFGRQPWHAGACPESMFTGLVDGLADITPRGQRRNAAVAYQILSLACASEQGEGNAHPAVLRCRDILEKEYADPALSIDSVARRIGIHRTRLSRLFRAALGVSPIDYLIAQRLTRGLFLLQSTDRTVSEIAYACGYHSPDYFSKAVRKATSQSPRAFRQR